MRRTETCYHHPVQAWGGEAVKRNLFAAFTSLCGHRQEKRTAGSGVRLEPKPKSGLVQDSGFGDWGMHMSDPRCLYSAGFSLSYSSKATSSAPNPFLRVWNLPRCALQAPSTRLSRPAVGETSEVFHSVYEEKGAPFRATEGEMWIKKAWASLTYQEDFERLHKSMTCRSMGQSRPINNQE